ncbi:SMC-Scp complex subunit ScpB, partial [bacterium]|nr:SMC-Scp complex subunit ScpB [bacterium]
PLETVQRDLDELAYALEPRGIRLQRIAGACRLVTAASCAGWVERYLDVNNRIRLNRPQLEALAIVAYNQPVTRAVIDTYRGVRSERVLGQLEDLRLIREVARADVPGRPILYGTTEEFLRYFALNSLDELPQLFPPPKPDEAAQRVPADPAPEASGREADNSGCGSEGASGAAGMSGSALDVPSERLQKLISKLRKKQ